MKYNDLLCHLPESRKPQDNAVEYRMKNRFTTLILLPVLMAALLPASGSAQQSYSLDDLVTIGL